MIEEKNEGLGKISRETVTDPKLPMFTEDWPTWQMLQDMRDFCLAKPSRAFCCNTPAQMRVVASVL